MSSGRQADSARTAEQPAWYDTFFDSIYREIDESRFAPENTAREVDFVEHVAHLAPGASVLDMCCGQGRHSLELARRGYRVTGIDRSASLIALARAGADAAGLEIDFRIGDMRDFVADGAFDAVLSLFFAWGYLESEAADQAALEVMASALKPGGQLVMEYQNRELVLRYLHNTWSRLPGGDVLLRGYHFEPATSRLSGEQSLIRRNGEWIERHFDLRLYTLTELSTRVLSAGLTPNSVSGGYAGEPFSLSSPLLILVASKSPRSATRPRHLPTGGLAAG